jgi:predicted secreted protein
MIFNYFFARNFQTLQLIIKDAETVRFATMPGARGIVTLNYEGFFMFSA